MTSHLTLLFGSLEPEPQRITQRNLPGLIIYHFYFLNAHVHLHVAVHGTVCFLSFFKKFVSVLTINDLKIKKVIDGLYKRSAYKGIVGLHWK